MEREIIYERTIYKSYMKIPAVCESSFDERLILKNKIGGTIFCEKSCVNGESQYWYDITGKQDLDSFCKVNSIRGDFFEYLLLSICNLFESMEWNLIKEKCLHLEPEMIFLNHTGEEVTFVLYPEQDDSDTFLSLERLMEYLLAKLDHTEKSLVPWAYEIYEYILNREYSIGDLKNKILKRRIEELEDDVQESVIVVHREEEKKEESEETEEIIEERADLWGELEKMIFPFYRKGKMWLEDRKKRDRKKQEDVPMVIYPEEDEICTEPEIHPTICIATMKEEPKGMLIYEGVEGYKDFEIGKLICVVGKSPKVKLQISKDTISQFHAKIDYQEGKYYIEDMNSTNGTYINGEMLNYKEKKMLQIGDVVSFADVKYRFL